MIELIKLEIVFKYKDQIYQGQVQDVFTNSLKVRLDHEIVRIAYSDILETLDFTQGLQYSSRTKKYRPTFTYSKAEFTSLWDEARTVQENVLDAMRYLLQYSEAPPLEFWWYHFTPHWETIQAVDYAEMLEEAHYLNLYHRASSKKLSYYIPGESVVIKVGESVVEVSQHAITRLFERMNVKKENLRALLLAILEDSVEVKSNSPKFEGVKLLYSSTFNWTFVTKEPTHNSLFILTNYESSTPMNKFKVVNPRPWDKVETKQSA